MFSRILIKLIDEAILPALLLLATKVLSIVFFSNYFSVAVSIDRTGFVYPSRESFVLINSYSTLAMVCVISIGLFYVLLKSNVFHETHIRPALTAKLYSFKLSSFIQTSFDVYSQGTIWLSYTFLLFLTTLVSVYLGLIYSWILYVSLILTLISTYLLIIDIEREVLPVKEQSNVNSEVVLSWEDETE